MVLRVTPTYAVLSGRIALHTWTAITKCLTYTRQEYGWVRGRGKLWQTVPVELWQRADDGALVFPSGLLHRVLPELDRRMLTSIHSEIVEPPTDAWDVVTTLADGTTLYPDQEHAVRVALAHRRGLLGLATNFGKTATMASLLATLPGRRAVVLVNQRGLITQLAGELTAKVGEPVNIWGGGGKRIRGDVRITISTVQALHHARRDVNLQQWLARHEVLLVDEADVISPVAWYPTLEACRTAWLRLGLSGTLREMRHPMAAEAFFGPVLYEVDDAALEAQGRSATTTVLMPYVGHAVPDGTDYDGEHGVYERGVVHHLARNRMLAQFAAAAATAGLAVLVSFYRLAQGHTLEHLCREHYLGPVVRLDGTSHPALLEQVKRDAGSGLAGIYLTGMGYNRGLDLPGVRVLINAAAWKSRQATSQRGGRVVRRKATGGNWALVVDPFDLGNSTLKRHSQERQRTYERKGFGVQRGTAQDLTARLQDLAATLMATTPTPDTTGA